MKNLSTNICWKQMTTHDGRNIDSRPKFEIPFLFFSLSLGESWSVEIMKRDLRTRPIPIFIKGTDEVKKDM